MTVFDCKVDCGNLNRSDCQRSDGGPANLNKVYLYLSLSIYIFKIKIWNAFTLSYLFLKFLWSPEQKVNFVLTFLWPQIRGTGAGYEYKVTMPSEKQLRKKFLNFTSKMFKVLEASSAKDIFCSILIELMGKTATFSFTNSLIETKKYS